MTLKQACQETGRSESTLRRWIRDGKLKATLLDNGKYDIDDADIEKLTKPTQKVEKTKPAPSLGTDTPTTLISQMTKQIDSQAEEIAFLRGELSKQTDEHADQSKRHDTIVLKMTQQLDRAQLQLEDLQKHPSLWQRLKTVFQNGY